VSDWVVLHKNGTYLQKWTAIGPMFGATIVNALGYATRTQAVADLGSSWMLDGVVRIEKRLKQLANPKKSKRKQKR